MIPSRSIPGYSRRRKRHVFTQEEDAKLRQLVDELGENNWQAVAQRMEGRNTRQCRDRWREYIRPNLVHSEWTEHEDQIILQKYAELGPRWSGIGAFLPERSEIQIKNRLRQLLYRYPAPRYGVQWVPVAQVPLPSSSSDQKDKDSSQDSSAGEIESLNTPKELEAFFNSLGAPKLRNGTKRFEC